MKPTIITVDSKGNVVIAQNTQTLSPDQIAGKLRELNIELVQIQEEINLYTSAQLQSNQITNQANPITP